MSCSNMLSVVATLHIVYVGYACDEIFFTEYLIEKPL